jgi:hypothetical protein
MHFQFIDPYDYDKSNEVGSSWPLFNPAVLLSQFHLEQYNDA